MNEEELIHHEHVLVHSLPTILPDPWDWPARRRKNGWWYLRFGSTERPVHRLVFMLSAGTSPYGRNDRHNCFWCGKPVVWGEDLQVDHINGNKDDCRPENLAASCAGCNRRKGRRDYTW